MSRKNITIQYAAVVLLLGCMVVWAHYHAVSVAEKAVAESEAREFEFWKSKLLPLYRDGHTRFHPDPKTREDLFAPLFQILEPIGNEPTTSAGKPEGLGDSGQIPK